MLMIEYAYALVWCLYNDDDVLLFFSLRSRFDSFVIVSPYILTLRSFDFFFSILIFRHFKRGKKTEWRNALSAQFSLSLSLD